MRRWLTLEWWKFYRWLGDWRRDWREARWEHGHVDDDTLARVRKMPGEWWREL